MGSDWAERYRYTYTYDDDGRRTQARDERHYSDARHEISVFTTDYGDSDGGPSATTFTGWFEGKNDWVDIYLIDRVFDDQGRVANEKHRERIVGLEGADPVLIERQFEYDADGRVEQNTVSVAAPGDAGWESQLASRREYEYAGRLGTPLSSQ